MANNLLFFGMGLYMGVGVAVSMARVFLSILGNRPEGIVTSWLLVFLWPLRLLQFFLRK